VGIVWWENNQGDYDEDEGEDRAGEYKRLSRSTWMTYVNHQIHGTLAFTASKAPIAPCARNPMGPIAPRMAKTVVRIRPGGYVLPSIATELGTKIE
jgi:hypothetical protein